MGGASLEQMIAGEDGWSKWIHPQPGYLMGCCDCGLVHEMEYRIVPGKDGDRYHPGESKKRVIIFRARRHEGLAA